jgi:predicted small lipoprotein YifL
MNQSHRRVKYIKLTTALIVISLLTMACGQRGPLYLPDNEAPKKELIK